ncbi:MAG: thioredoxin family protein [Bacteroidia bacterium]|nr:thioredoxin family protein [Bacteroidia bacterium]MCZ2249560.1 thioredoxin family protein [Bacteroidia bacterium]
MDKVIDKLQNKDCYNLEVARINTDTYAKAAVKYKVRNVPTLLICNQGQVLWRQTGLTTLAEIEIIIKDFTFAR